MIGNFIIDLFNGFQPNLEQLMKGRSLPVLMIALQLKWEVNIKNWL